MWLLFAVALIDGVPRLLLSECLRRVLRLKSDAQTGDDCAQIMVEALSVADLRVNLFVLDQPLEDLSVNISNLLSQLDESS